MHYTTTRTYEKGKCSHRHRNKCSHADAFIHMRRLNGGVAPKTSFDMTFFPRGDCGKSSPDFTSPTIFLSLSPHVQQYAFSTPKIFFRFSCFLYLFLSYLVWNETGLEYIREMIPALDTTCASSLDMGPMVEVRFACCVIASASSTSKTISLVKDSFVRLILFVMDFDLFRIQCSMFV